VLDLSICSDSIIQYFKQHLVLDASPSDHQPTITSFVLAGHFKRTVEITKTNWEAFRNNLLRVNADLSPINTSTELNSAAEYVSKAIWQALQDAQSRITIQAFNSSPLLIPKKILLLIKLKRYVRRVYQKFKITAHKTYLNLVERRLKSELKLFRQIRFENKFTELSKFNPNSSKHWDLINELAENSASGKVNICKPFVVNNQLVSDSDKVAELFAENLTKTFSSPESQQRDLNSIPPLQIAETTSYASIEASELIEHLNSLNSKASPGIDGISNKVLKNCPENILASFCHIFNSSLKLGCIPKAWKSSKIVMIPKKGKDKTDLNSYRPISLLNCIGKWLEKIINSKLQFWLEANKVLPDAQSGFRKNKSTQDQILRLTQDIVHGFNNSERTAAIFFDLEKAFDKASHSGLLYKLKEKGLDATLWCWIKNFLDDRSFCVSHQGARSKFYPITCGVPQGSSLSPTLFILFFSDVVKSLPSNVKVALYADDLCIWATHKSLKKLRKILQAAADQVALFCKEWDFKINIAKTAYTVFTTAGFRKNYESKYKLEIKIDGSQITMDPFPKFLGITLDPKLSFKRHLERISNITLAKINIFRRIKSFNWRNGKKLSLILYNSLIRSLFDYCHVIDQCGTQRLTGYLQKIQNRILRIIKWFPLKTSSKSIHEYFNIAPIDHRLSSLFKKFVQKRNDHALLQQEIKTYIIRPNSRFSTPFDHIVTAYQ